MTDTHEVRRYADAIMTLIKEDQDAGQVPGDACSWDELDDSVDTEDYYRRAQMPAATPEAISLRNAVNDEVSRRLGASQGGPWGVSWTSPDGHQRDIGRTIGYATRAEADTVGQEYLSKHGGAYQVYGS
ncbi:MAG TPA: hypothetical protein VEC76_19755 [Streptosporangiaceae bacterium]|nr:hypothetical protein [Streptosporangiaceae bacterium]